MMFANAVQAKLASMVVIGAGSFIIGIAPTCFVSHAQHLQRKLLLSCALCFGAGVLLATATLHVLPEVRQDLPNYAELVFICGFLALYLIDECAHYFCRDCTHEPIEMTDPRGPRIHEITHDTNASHIIRYNAAMDRKACASEGDLRSPFTSRQTPYGNNANNAWAFSSYGTMRCSRNADPFNEEATSLCHRNHGEHCGNDNTADITGLVGLALALTVHAILEGLAVGLQTQIAEVLLLTGAVASHKFVVGFCLGLELAGSSRSIARLVLVIFLFSGGSVLGIGIGMLTFQMDTSWSKIALPILQGLAGGTLLYVTVSEVLPRERARWHKNSRRYAGILQFFSVVGGFVVIFLLNSYVGT